MAAAWAIASSRVTFPSRRPRVAANPLLVVARAAKPSEANSFAEPRSHGLGSSSGSGPLCSARKRSACWIWVAMAPNVSAGRLRPVGWVGGPGRLVVGVLRPRELPGHDLLPERTGGLAENSRDIGIALHEPRRARGQARHVLPDQHLGVAAGPGTDPD